MGSAIDPRALTRELLAFNTINPPGNYREEATGEPTGLNIPHLSKPLADQAGTQPGDVSAFAERIAGMRQQLLDVRVKRVWPGLDDKVLTAWNGLMIGSLAHGGRIAHFERAEMQAFGFEAHMRVFLCEKTRGVQAQT